MCVAGDKEKGGKKKIPSVANRVQGLSLLTWIEWGEEREFILGEKTEIIHRALFLPKYSPPSRCGEYKLFQNCYHALCDLGLT